MFSYYKLKKNLKLNFCFIKDYLLHFFQKVEKAEKSVSIPDELIYISIHDAVVYAQKKYLTKL